MGATNEIIVPKFRKSRLRTVGEKAFGVTTDKQTDAQSDNKGRLELSGAREPTDGRMYVTALRSQRTRSMIAGVFVQGDWLYRIQSTPGTGCSTVNSRPSFVEAAPEVDLSR